MVLSVEKEEEEEKGREQTCWGGECPHVPLHVHIHTTHVTLQSHCTCVTFNVNSPLQPPAEDALDSPSSPPSSSQLPAKARDGTPPSPHWRRSPSYEKLQEMVFSSSPTSSLSRPNPRRSHTLSLSGSDVFREEPSFGELLGEAIVVSLLVEYCRKGRGREG